MQSYDSHKVVLTRFVVQQKMLSKTMSSKGEHREIQEMSVTAQTQSKTRARGFTIIELMTTVAVLSVISAISYTSLDRMLTRARARGAYQEFVTALQQTREEALIRRAPTVFRLVVPASGSDTGLRFESFVDARSNFDPSDFDLDDTSFTVLSTRELPTTLALQAPSDDAPSLPAPFSSVPADAACSFCESSGASFIVFGSDGSARLGSTPQDHSQGGSISLFDSVKNEKFTIAILARGFVRSFER